MKKRAMKKWIPKNTHYCYQFKRVVRDTEGKPWIITSTCRNYVYFKAVDDEVCIPNSNGDMEYHPVKRAVYRCRYTGITTEEDYLLDDQCKVCGEKEPRF